MSDTKTITVTFALTNAYEVWDVQISKDFNGDVNDVWSDPHFELQEMRESGNDGMSVEEIG